MAAPRAMKAPLQADVRAPAPGRWRPDRHRRYYQMGPQRRFHNPRAAVRVRLEGGF
jgi:hypothetical protein